MQKFKYQEHQSRPGSQASGVSRWALPASLCAGLWHPTQGVCHLCSTKSDLGQAGDGGEGGASKDPRSRWLRGAVATPSGHFRKRKPGEAPPGLSTWFRVRPSLLPSTPRHCLLWDRAPLSPTSSPQAAGPGSSAPRGDKPARCQGPT